jgi:tetratricopeptide (TPR) repeat protein
MQQASSNELAELQKKVSEIESSKGKDHADLIPVLTRIAEAYRELGGYIPATPFAKRAWEITAKLRGESHLETAAALDFLATLYRLQGDNESALQNYERALHIIKGSAGADHPAYAIVLKNLAEAHLATGQIAQAERVLQQAGKIIDDQFGAVSGEATMIHLALAEVCLRTGYYTKAEQLFIFVLTVRSEGLDLPVQAGQTSDLEVRAIMAPVENLLGRLYTIVGLYEKAKPLLEDALKHYEAKLGPDHCLLEGVLVNLAAESSATGKTTAVDYQKRAEQVHAKNIGYAYTADAPRAKPLQTEMHSRSGTRPHAGARVGDWVVYGDEQRHPLQKSEIIAMTPVVAVVSLLGWDPTNQQWAQESEQIVDLSADLKELYGVAEKDWKPGKAKVGGVEVDCVTAISTDKGKTCKMFLSPRVVPLGGIVKVECDGKLLVQTIEYHRGK